jgi:hypothetical protein
MMIFFVAQDGTSPVYLLSKDEPDKLVRKNKLRKAPLKITPLADGLAHAICSTNKEYDIFGTFV